MVALSGKRQHFIAQLHSRQFAGDAGLYMLDKHTGRIDKPKSPKAVLYGDNFYGPAGNAFDEQFLKPTEDEYAKHLPPLLDPQRREFSDETLSALTAWVATLSVRTSFLPAAGLCGEGDVEAFEQEAQSRGIAIHDYHAMARVNICDVLLKLFELPDWHWRRIIYQTSPGNELVLTDHPVAVSRTHAAPEHPFVAVALSKNVLAIGGRLDVTSHVPIQDVGPINTTFVAHADRRIYSGDRMTLERIAAGLARVRAGEAEELSFVLPSFAGLTRPKPSREYTDWSHEDSIASMREAFGFSESGRAIDSGEETAMAVKPLEDRVLVKPIEAESKTASGLYLPEGAKEKPIQGKVVATGPGKRLDNGQRAHMSVKKGDTVVYGKYAGSEIEIKGDKHLILRESELLGVIDG